MRVGLLGVQCDTANLGLAALTYSCLALLHRRIPAPEFVLFSGNSDRSLAMMRAELGLEAPLRAVPFRHRNARAMAGSLDEMRACDVVIDFTGGDSFSDIYGLTRLLRKLTHKQMVLTARTPLVLGPQTYGPLRSRAVRPWFRHVVEQAELVFARDDLSLPFLNRLATTEVHRVTDVAVALPYRPPASASLPRSRPHVGFNVSGLLWSGGYHGHNDLRLASDYRGFCRGVVDGLSTRGYEVWLVPHVLTRSGESPVEDDVAASRELQGQRPDCQLAPGFANPVEAKSWIAGLDAFIGSRMHATIAALTAGVPTIPAEYSRKFAGFFGNLGYHVGVDLVRLRTDDAIAQVMERIDDLEGLRAMVEPARTEAHARIEVFNELFASLLRRLPRC